MRGRSQLIASEVSDTILSIMPSLMCIFTTAGQFVQYEAGAQEGEANAAAGSAYMKDVVFTKDNDIFSIGYNWEWQRLTAFIEHQTDIQI